MKQIDPFGAFWYIFLNYKNGLRRQKNPRKSVKKLKTLMPAMYIEVDYKLAVYFPEICSAIFKRSLQRSLCIKIKVIRQIQCICTEFCTKITPIKVGLFHKHSYLLF